MARMLIKAAWILPLASEPIENGWIRIDDGIITEIGQGPVGSSFDKLRTTAIDLGNTALYPGLINCHAHLEFDCGDHPKDSFAAWATSVQSSQHGTQDIEASWQRNIQRLLATGTTTVVNHGNQFAGAASSAPTPHVIQVCEFVGASADNGARSYRDACTQRLDLLKSHLVEDAVVSPHSVYAVSPVVWDEFVRQHTGGSRTAPTELISMHLKESAEEDRLFREGKGALAQLVKERGGLLWQHDPVGWLKEKHLLGPKTLLIHGNYLDERDSAHLQGSGASVIHCPSSHAYFGHRAFPLRELRDKKVRIALGTDSLASNEDLNMLREMRLFRRGGSPCPPADDIHLGPPRGGAPTTKELIQMATINGAEALGINGTRGTLEVGKWADIIAVQMRSQQDPYDALFNADQVNLTMVRGRIVHRDGV